MTLPSSRKIKLGILGGGQLGRMSAQAARKLGIETVIYCPEQNSPASQVADETIVAAYADEAALREFGYSVDHISYEFENIPTDTIDYLASLKQASVLPAPNLLLVAQDRIDEKTFLNDLGIKTARWKAVQNIEDVDVDKFIIKTVRFGYDGKGQIKSYKNDPALPAFFEQHKRQNLILEHIVDFKCEISVVIARDHTGRTETYGPMLNDHKNHILHHTRVPGGQDDVVRAQTIDIAQQISEDLNLIGVLTVEFFVTQDDTLLVNEIAPRTHNSGHWSIDACAASQFENHVRCVCGLDVAPAAPHSDALMINLIGDDINKIDAFEVIENAYIHLYGKTEARAGRKMGHITILNPDDRDYDALIRKKEI